MHPKRSRIVRAVDFDEATIEDHCESALLADEDPTGEDLSVAFAVAGGVQPFHHCFGVVVVVFMLDGRHDRIDGIVQLLIGIVRLRIGRDHLDHILNFRCLIQSMKLKN